MRLVRLEGGRTPQPSLSSLFSDNRLLAGLSRPERSRLASATEEQYLELKRVVFEPNERIEHVHFPLDGMCCLLTVLNDGSSIEVATVGSEGMLGVGTFLGFDSYLWRGICQIPGRVLRIDASAFKEELGRSGKLLRIVQRYAHALLAKVGQAVACNRLHSTEQRCCKWLLLTHDSAASDDFPLTQEFLSQMLGVRRAGVSEVASNLQNAGLIRYRRGTVTILDRRGLERSSCECYATIRKTFEGIF